MNDDFETRKQQPVFIARDRSSLSLSWKFDHVRLSIEARSLYITLCRRANDEHQTWPSVGTLGEWCFWDLSSDRQKKKTRLALIELKDAGLIEIRKRMDVHTGANTTRLYTIKPDEHYAPIAVKKGLASDTLVENERRAGTVPANTPKAKFGFKKTYETVVIEDEDEDLEAQGEVKNGPPQAKNNPSQKQPTQVKNNPPPPKEKLKTKGGGSKTTPPYCPEVTSPPQAKSKPRVEDKNGPQSSYYISSHQISVHQDPDSFTKVNEVLKADSGFPNSHSDTVAVAPVVLAGAPTQSSFLNSSEPLKSQITVNKPEGKLLVEEKDLGTAYKPAPDLTSLPSPFLIAKKKYYWDDGRNLDSRYMYDDEEVPAKWIHKEDYVDESDYPHNPYDVYAGLSPEEKDELYQQRLQERQSDPMYQAVKARWLEMQQARKEADEFQEEQDRLNKMVDQLEAMNHPPAPEPPPKIEPKGRKLTQEEALSLNQLLDFGLVCCWSPCHMNMKSSVMKPNSKERLITMKMTQPYLRQINSDTWMATQKIARLLAHCTYQAKEAQEAGDIARVNWYLPTLMNLTSSTNHFNKISIDYAMKYPSDNLDLGRWFEDIDSNAERLKQRLAEIDPK